MSFHSPHLLWLLIPLVLLFSWELAHHTARAAATFPKIARAWAGAFNVSLGVRHTTAETRPRIWLWFGLAFCIVALARPQWGVIEEQVFDQSREVLIAVDLSKSMLAQDVKPSRLDRSKLLIQSLLDSLKGERVGLVVFAGTSFLQSPLSSDYEILREFLPAMGPDYLPEGGTNYRALLETAIQAFGTSTADRYLIVLSDGDATDDDWKPLVEQLKAKGIRIIGLGVGTQQGSFIPDAGGGFVKDERGAVVLARLNGSTLQELAQMTGGAYTDASSWIDLPALLKKTVEAGTKGDFSEKNTARKVERYQWFLAPGLLLLLISFWAEFPVRPRERALPLGAARPRTAGKSATTASVAAAISLLCALGAAHRALAEDSPADTFSKPLSTTVARLAEQPTVTAKDYSELAQTTITYGQRAKSAQQRAPEKVIEDALQAVDLGEKIDTKAAEWPRLRQELQELLKKEEPPKQDQKNKDQEKDKDKKDQDQQKQDQQKDPQQNQDKNQQKDQDKEKSDQQKQNDQKQQPDQQNQPQKQNQQDAFGDMKDKQEQKAQPKPQPPPSGTQKVGGQQEKKSDEQQDPELAMPLQKLEQVRNQDSPAKLQQIMQGQQQQQKPKATAKDW
jgi:Ca-activated chloride channel homolog